MKADLAFDYQRMQAVEWGGREGERWKLRRSGPLTVDDVQSDGVRLGVRGRARELAGVPQVCAGDPERAHQPPPAMLGHLQVQLVTFAYLKWYC